MHKKNVSIVLKPEDFTEMVNIITKESDKVHMKRSCCVISGKDIK